MQKGHNGTINNPNIRVLEVPPPPIITTVNGGGVPACASCRHQRKKCTEKCILAPYFPAEKSSDFQAVHKIFGVSNVTKLVKGLSREDGKQAVDSLIWEATWRIKEPVHGPYKEYIKVCDQLREYQKQFQQANIEHQLRQVVPIQGHGVLYNNKSGQQCLIGSYNGDHHNGITNGNSMYGIVGNGIDNSRILNYGLQNMDKSLKPERDQQHASFPQQMMNGFNPFNFD